MQSLHKKVWAYKTFSELSPEAAKKAIQDDSLFSLDLPWGKTFDPTKADKLYKPDGEAVQLTVSERAKRFSIAC
jgi:hypothetical protein